MDRNATVVSCYYKFPSKHTAESYDEWIHLFLEPFEGYMVIYTSADLVDYFQGIISKKKNPTNILVIPRDLYQLPIYIKYKHIWENQEKYDKANNPASVRSNRSKECFILWNSKLEFLKEAIDLNPFGSDKFVWNDIGNVRNPFIKEVISAYPKSVCVSEDKVDITVIRNPGLSAAMLEKIHVYRSSGGNVPCFQNEILLSGSIFGSSAETLLKFHTAFYKMFDYYLSENKFIGCDQQIMASILLTNPELFNLIDPYKVGLPKGVDPWFSLQFFYISA